MWYLIFWIIRGVCAQVMSILTSVCTIARIRPWSISRLGCLPLASITTLGRIYKCLTGSIFTQKPCAYKFISRVYTLRQYYYHHRIVAFIFPLLHLVPSCRAIAGVWCFLSTNLYTGVVYWLKDGDLLCRWNTPTRRLPGLAVVEDTNRHVYSPSYTVRGWCTVRLLNIKVAMTQVERLKS